MKNVLKALGLTLFFLVLVRTANAANLTGAKDTMTTSRPSASTPLSANVALGAGSASVLNNGSIFLASDSAKLVNTPTNTFFETNLNIASQSAAKTTVLFTNSFSAARAGSINVLTVPVTAKHTVVFTTSTYIPATGTLEIILPAGNTANPASPSATGFSFNGLASGDLSISGATCASWTFTPASGLIKCTNLSSAVASNTLITVTIGATNPVLINPTKQAAAGTADTWAVSLNTYDNAGLSLDSTKIKIGTIDSVQVRAVVEPTLTFTIAGLNNGTVISANNTACGSGGTQTTNTGINATATVADLGTVSNGQVNVAAQDLTVSTNLSGGYVLTATSSGQLWNSSTGYQIDNAQGPVTNNETPVPVAITAATEAFGIHACGTDVATATWGTRSSAANVKYANPSPSYYYTLASRTSSANLMKTTVVYGGTVSATTPPGLYLTTLTYVATPIF